jgi:hypothetical protein
LEHGILPQFSVENDTYNAVPVNLRNIMSVGKKYNEYSGGR